MVIYNVPQDINVESLEEAIMKQNAELGLIQVDIAVKFTFRTNENG